VLYIVRKKSKVKRKTLLKKAIVLSHANTLKEKPKALSQYHFWNSSIGLSHQLLAITPQSISSPAAAVQHAQKEKKQ